VEKKLLKKSAASDKITPTSPPSVDLKNTLLRPMGIISIVSKPAS